MRRYILLVSGLLLSAAAFAQNLNPTVEVTNTYEGKLMEVNKTNLQMAVPDSLLRFDWNFNYSVFENPYKGAYEFTPYLIDMRPDARTSDANNFYLRLGAGYSYHPEATLFWNPQLTPRLTLSIYDKFRGYMGEYYSIDTSEDSFYTGRDLYNVAGVGAKYNARSITVSLDADFHYLNTKDEVFDGNGAWKTKVRAGINSVNTKHFYYGLSGYYSGLKNSSRLVAEADPFSFAEDGFGAELEAGFNIGKHYAIDVTGSYDRYAFGDAVTLLRSKYNIFQVTPSFRFRFKHGSVNLGITYADMGMVNSMYIPEQDRPTGLFGKHFYPDARARFEIIRDALVVTGKFVGGQDFNKYSSLLEDNHHLTFTQSALYSRLLCGATATTYDAGIGLSGRLVSRFQYKAETGFADYKNALLDGILFSSASESFIPYIYATDYNVGYADVSVAFVSDRFTADAHYRFQDPLFKSNTYAFTLPRHQADASIQYNWNHRLFLGLSADYMSKRRGGASSRSYDKFHRYEAPAYIDLGASAEFKFAGKFSLWAKGGNLLNQKVTRHCIYAERGPYFTAGICLDL